MGRGKKGRPAKEGLRRPGGRLSEARGARPDDDDGLVRSQPHRRPFAALLGEQASKDWRAAFALGRLRLIGEAEERAEVTGVDVRAILFGGARNAPPGPFGISERQFQAGLKWIETVGRERWIRATPKDKPSAMAFMTARGIDLSTRDPTSSEAIAMIAAFEDARAALLAAECPNDVRHTLKRLRSMARQQNNPDMVRLLQGLGPLTSPAQSAAVAAAVNAVGIDDRDATSEEMVRVRRGLDALADQFFGPQREGSRIVGSVQERAVWPHDERTVEILYPDGQGGTRAAHQEPVRRPRTRDKADRDHPYR